MEELKSFYEKLYTSSNTRDRDFETFTNDPTLPKLTDLERELCDRDLTIDECTESLKSLKNNKSPGTDGITIEFYNAFWDKLGIPLLDSFKYSFENGELSSSQKQDIITLLEKQGKDRNYTRSG